MSASSNAVRRLRRDYDILQRSGNKQIVVRPSPECMLCYHFILHDLPSDSPYAGGCYHGKLVFPEDYPNTAPKIMMVTPNGRLEENEPVCVTMSDTHPGSWNPTWSIETILVGLISFMLDENEKLFDGVVWRPRAWRQKLAKQSWSFNANDELFTELFPEWRVPPGSALSSSSAEDVTPAAMERVAEQTAQHVHVIVDEVVPPTQRVEHRPVTEEGSTNSQQAVTVEDIAPPPNSAERGPCADEESVDLPECSICGLTGEDEPLIRPCACRGTMSGMHASCLHTWIRRHRQSESHSDGPRCGICGHAYSGVDEKPGCIPFVQHHCGLLPGGTKSLLRGALCILKLAVLLGMYAVFLKPDNTITLWLGDPLLLGLFYLYFLQRVMMVILPPLSDGVNDRSLLRFLLARDQHQVNVASWEIELLQFGAFFLSVRQCFIDKPAFCVTKEAHEGATLETIMRYHDCQNRQYEDNMPVRVFGSHVFWYLPHKLEIVAYLPHMGLILYVLPASLVSEVSQILAAFRDERSMNWRLAKELGVRLTKLFALFVAIPLLVLERALVLPATKNHERQFAIFRHILGQELILWRDAFLVLLVLLCIFSPCIMFWYYRNWQYRNGEFTLREPLLSNEAP